MNALRTVILHTLYICEFVENLFYYRWMNGNFFNISFMIYIYIYNTLYIYIYIIRFIYIYNEKILVIIPIAQKLFYFHIPQIQKNV